MKRTRAYRCRLPSGGDDALHVALATRESDTHRVARLRNKYLVLGTSMVAAGRGGASFLPGPWGRNPSRG